MCSLAALESGPKVGLHLNTYVMLRLHGLEDNSVHGVGGPGISATNVHNFTFVHIKFYTPDLCPLNKFVKTFLEVVYVTLIDNNITKLGVICKFIHDRNQQNEEKVNVIDKNHKGQRAKD